MRGQRETKEDARHEDTAIQTQEGLLVAVNTTKHHMNPLDFAGNI